MQQYRAFMRKPGSIPEETRRALQAAQADIGREAEAVQRSAQALSVARDIVESARGELARLETDDRAAIEQHRHVLERWILDGNNSGAPPPTAGQSNDTVIAKRRAEVSFEAAKQALASLERRHSDNRNKQLAAEQRLASLEQDAADSHEHELVDEAEKLVSRLEEIGQTLHSRRNTQRSNVFLSTPIMRPLVEQLAKLTAIMGGVVADVNSPISGNTQGRQVGTEHWAKFRASLKEAVRPRAGESTAEIGRERVA
jgi:hypothetical protein